MTSRHSSRIICSLLSLQLAISCAHSDEGTGLPPPPPPTTGAVTVRTVTSGQTLDPDGYTLVLDSGTSVLIGVNDTTVFSDVSPGAHTVALAGVASNCAPSGPITQTVNVTAGGNTRLTASVSCQRVIRNEVVFVSSRDGNAELYVMEADGTRQTRLTTNAAPDYAPSISSDGRQLAFASNRTGNDDIYVADAHTMIAIQRTVDLFYDTDPAWSPNDSTIAYINNQQLWVMNADGTGNVRLTNDSAVLFNQWPAWSPDGSRIAFYSSHAGNGDIYVINPDGTNEQALTTVPAVDWQPAWSPDGQKIAFVSYRDGNPEIYVMNADGSSQTRLTFSPSDDFHPWWSADGAKIVFQSNRAQASHSDIWVMNADGANPIRLTTAAGNDTEPKWSWAP
jgi:Tol biopolymer transport system component